MGTMKRILRWVLGLLVLPATQQIVWITNVWPTLSQAFTKRL